MIIDVDHFMERSYLDGLAAALKIAPEEKAALDSEVEETKRHSHRTVLIPVSPFPPAGGEPSNGGKSRHAEKI